MSGGTFALPRLLGGRDLLRLELRVPTELSGIDQFFERDRFVLAVNLEFDGEGKERIAVVLVPRDEVVKVLVSIGRIRLRLGLYVRGLGGGHLTRGARLRRLGSRLRGFAVNAIEETLGNGFQLCGIGVAGKGIDAGRVLTEWHDG